MYTSFAALFTLPTPPPPHPTGKEPWSLLPFSPVLLPSSTKQFEGAFIENCRQQSLSDVLAF